MVNQIKSINSRFSWFYAMTGIPVISCIDRIIMYVDLETFQKNVKKASDWKKKTVSHLIGFESMPLIILPSQYINDRLLYINRPAVENQKIKCNEPMGYTPISYVIGKRNDGTLRKNDAVKVGSGHVFA